MKKTFLGPALVALAFASQAAPVNSVSYGALIGTQIVDFDDLPAASASGVNYDATFISRGVGFGERFVGQILGAAVQYDTLSGTPAGPLAVVAGAPSQNLDLLFYNGSNVLTGLGNLGFPNFDAVGEGSFAALFSSDQSEFGFQLVGGNGGSADVSFFRRDGSLISVVTLDNLSDAFYGFSREGGVHDIAGISITNNDPAGIGFDNLKHDVPSNVPGVPEPETYALMLAGLAAVGWLRRRRG